jgi:flagellar biosynthesis chaperone FliJ
LTGPFIIAAVAAPDYPLQALRELRQRAVDAGARELAAAEVALASAARELASREAGWAGKLAERRQAQEQGMGGHTSGALVAARAYVARLEVELIAARAAVELAGQGLVAARATVAAAHAVLARAIAEHRVVLSHEERWRADRQAEVERREDAAADDRAAWRKR